MVDVDSSSVNRKPLYYLENTIFGKILEASGLTTSSPDVVCVNNMDKIGSIGVRLMRVDDNILEVVRGGLGAGEH